MELSRIASSQVAFFYGNTLIVSTLQKEQQSGLARLTPNPSDFSGPISKGFRLGEEEFLASPWSWLPVFPLRASQCPEIV